MDERREPTIDRRVHVRILFDLDFLKYANHL
jgi:hypothetical protein